MYPDVPLPTEIDDDSCPSNDLDSYMFQTVGVEVIPLIAECMQKPLLRAPIKGTALNQDMNYEKAENTNEGDGKIDEIEELYELVKQAKETYNIEAVCSGAILSDYQRIRVENICKRLNLTSLAYLYKKDQSELLNQMIENRLDARIIKIASFGLDTSFLMKSISELQSRLEDLKVKHQINVCGEGGEYESIVLDCPLFINNRIKVDEYKVVTIDDDEYAPVAHIVFIKFGLEAKETEDPIELYPTSEEESKVNEG